MYVVGAPAGEWSPSKGVEMTETANGWEWSGLIGENDYFCFATALADGWTTFNTEYRLAPNTQNLEATPGEYALVLGQDRSFRGCGLECTYTVYQENYSNMAFAESYKDITIILDMNRGTLRALTEGSGITSIDGNEEESFYFNLQGAKVEKDTKGVIIRVTSGKAEKILVK